MRELLKVNDDLAIVHSDFCKIKPKEVLDRFISKYPDSDSAIIIVIEHAGGIKLTSVYWNQLKAFGALNQEAIIQVISRSEYLDEIEDEVVDALLKSNPSLTNLIYSITKLSKEQKPKLLKVLPDAIKNATPDQIASVMDPVLDVSEDIKLLISQYKPEATE